MRGIPGGLKFDQVVAAVSIRAKIAEASKLVSNWWCCRPENRVYFYDAHTYYPLGDAVALDTAKQFKEQMQKRFGSESNFYFGPTHTKAVGPHYEGQFKIVFTREDYAEVVNWLTLNRPLDLSILIHPHTLDAVRIAHLALLIRFIYQCHDLTKQGQRMAGAGIFF